MSEWPVVVFGVALWLFGCALLAAMLRDWFR